MLIRTMPGLNVHIYMVIFSRTTNSVSIELGSAHMLSSATNKVDSIIQTVRFCTSNHLLEKF